MSNRRSMNSARSFFHGAPLFAALLAGVAGRGQPSPAQQAEESFQARCSTCHAEHGEGSEVGASLNVPDLRSPAVQKNEDAVLRQIIRNGKNNMPSFGRDFSDEEIDRLLELVRSFAKKADASPTRPGG